MRLLLIMRNSYAWNVDHIDALRGLNIDIVLATGLPHAERDPRFAAVVPVPTDMPMEQAVDHLVAAARQHEITTALTFYESDTVLTSAVNVALGHTWTTPDRELLGRNKRHQREFLQSIGAPVPRTFPVDSVSDGLAAAEKLDFPMIVKPSFLSASIGVRLVADAAELQEALGEAERLTQQWAPYFLAHQGPDSDRSIALLEEFLPGKEVTVDGVALFGRFHLAAVTDKLQMPGPYFEEDYYTLPYGEPQEEPELTALCQAIIDQLGIRHCLFNAEFRRDTDGRYRVLEFATRLSGGQNYRNFRDVHGIDVVRLYAKAVLSGSEDETWSGELPRVPARMATCIKYAYRDGVVLRNNAGDTAHSPHFRDYYPLVKPGGRAAHAPEAWNAIAGSLSVGTPYRDSSDLVRVQEIATALDRQLDILVVPR